MVVATWVYIGCWAMVLALLVFVIGLGLADKAARQKRLLTQRTHAPSWREMLRAHQAALRLLGNMPEISKIDPASRCLITFHESRTGVQPRRLSTRELREAVAKLRGAANSLASVADWLERQGGKASR